MAKSYRLRQLLYKIESSYNTDPTPTVSANYLEVLDLNIEPIVSDEAERQIISGYFGNYPVELVNKRANVTFSCYLSGSGTAGTAPKYGDALKACNMTQAIVSSTSVTYSPNSSTSGDSLTFYVNYNGVRQIIKGSRGTFNIEMTAGELPVINFTFTGTFATPTDSAIGSPTKSNQAVPLAFTAGNTSAFQLFSYAGAVQSWSFDMANEVVFRSLVGSTDTVTITDRKPTGTAVIEAVAMSAKNFIDSASNSAQGNNTLLHGTAAGNKVQLSCPQTDLGAITYEESDQVWMLNCPYRAIPTEAGNNEVEIKFL